MSFDSFAVREGRVFDLPLVRGGEVFALHQWAKASSWGWRGQLQPIKRAIMETILFSYRKGEPAMANLRKHACNVGVDPVLRSERLDLSIDRSKIANQRFSAHAILWFARGPCTPQTVR